MRNNSKCTANVIAKENVSCMSLSRADFHVLLSSIEEEMMKANMLKSGEDSTSVNTLLQRNALKQLSVRRRISGVDVHNTRTDARVDNLLRRMARFMTESLWNSLYSRYYRALCLMSDEAASAYGPIAVTLAALSKTETRAVGVQRLTREVNRVLKTDLAARAAYALSRGITSRDITDASPDALLIMGMFQQRNVFTQKLCEGWTRAQHIECARRFKLVEVPAMNRVFGFSDIANSVYVILRGAVRVFSQQMLSSDNHTFRRVFQEDLFPGEILGIAYRVML